jgi:RNA recognition motif-containing protein
MSGYRLFIGQLVKDVRRRELEDAFGKFGEIVRIDIKNGFGFIVRKNTFILYLFTKLKNFLMFSQNFIYIFLL